MEKKALNRHDFTASLKCPPLPPTPDFISKLTDCRAMSIKTINFVWKKQQQKKKKTIKRHNFTASLKCSPQPPDFISKLTDCRAMSIKTINFARKKTTTTTTTKVKKKKKTHVKPSQFYGVIEMPPPTPTPDFISKLTDCRATSIKAIHFA